ncbi:hypothetical protein [Gloeobacter kilaueensis]|uniref:Uncharacterized protein n=1 Tax=Gloeobacter kilaueensis (strain ATCC BAA-2537 / CCAP 1431/1 / ULC 316 / JS1) TaxID=1183438 RepID=U5QEJ3_GLOK1|nr:hypothetical protein [Gloeobacter kilaueensis]AGY57357.1 hypothetical protein GKIL_1111 [Gloeobacter kilaueensis JS1]
MLHGPVNYPRRLELETNCPVCGRRSQWHATEVLLWETCPIDGLLELFPLFRSDLDEAIEHLPLSDRLPASKTA